MQQDSLEHLGGFDDLEDHDDSTLYSKEEPPRSLSGRRLPGKKRLDFLCLHRECGGVAIEVKNVRPWLYPHQDEVVDLIAKAVALDCVPVLIARRIPFVYVQGSPPMRRRDAPDLQSTVPGGGS